ncbi:hypothetical protein [Chryseobacterium sp. JV274]|uniref:hypothetical protein n=1 Tax=Chryseobacterium sp. JV274 TaxID=1932669 RepID=UPI0009873A8E|nr:hypothetical protein [Chryseobacterium sp. JV274]
MFIKVQLLDSKEIFINIHHLISVSPSSNGSTILVSTAPKTMMYKCAENPESIIAKVNNRLNNQ